MRKKQSTILLVDSDRRDREFMRTVLENTGYTVFEAIDYWEAIETHRQHEGHIDLLLTAFALPGDNGYELARALFRTDEHVKALFVSGRTGAEVSPYYHMPTAGPHMLGKPIRPGELLERVRHVLTTRTLRLKKGAAGETI